MIYFAPDLRAITPEHIARLGLGYAFDGPARCREVSQGPDRRSGVVFTAISAGPLGYFPDKQTWEQIPNSQAWCGFDRNERPTPKDYERKMLLPGYPVVLSDGHEWRIPVARLVSGASTLPRAIKWDGASWAEGDVLPRFADLYQAACKLWDDLRESGDAVVDYDLAVNAIACNYRIGAAEVSALGLLDTSTGLDVLRALIDWPALMACQKKIVSGETTLEPGEQD